MVVGAAQGEIASADADGYIGRIPVDAAISSQIAPAACCFTLPSAMPLTRR